jgi:predicted amidohydrolase
MRIGHCQADSRLGDFKGNLDRLISGMEKADSERVEIVSFPECFLTGYPDTEELAREGAFGLNSPQMTTLLDASSRFESALIVGFNESRGPDLYNTAVVCHKGHLLGHYSKCSAYQRFHRQGRDFPVFQHNGVIFGVIICSDGGYIEPARLLAFKGARIVFAPHFNYIRQDGLIAHFTKVRADHIARAVENSIWFVRGNNVSLGREECIQAYEGVGYGDSYIVDPHGEILVRSRRHSEDFIFADVDVSSTDNSWGMGRSLWSAREFGAMLMELQATQVLKQ